MSTIKVLMTEEEFTDTLCKIADTTQNCYAWGTWGWPGSDANKTRAKNKSGQTSQMKKDIDALPRDGYMFDCAGLIKGVLWGFCFDPNRPYGGAGYNCNSVPDTSSLISYCTNVSKDFTHLKRGELLYMPGHVGVVINPYTGLVVECTEKWDRKVLYSHIKGKPFSGTPADKRERKWTSHGMLPWVDYTKLDKMVKCPYCGREFINDDH